MAAPEQVIQMASLGRPFRLGMVYDCRSDTLIPGITLWDPKELKENIDVQPQPYVTSQILSSDSTSEKASLLNASASLKGSFLAGLIEVEGSAKFLQDTKKSTRQARVTFSYAATTHFQQLTMSQVGKQHITYPEVFGQGLATHVVTGILYGAHAFFVFDQEASSSENLGLRECDLEKHERDSGSKEQFKLITKKCYECGKLGHLRYNCPNIYGRDSRSNMKTAYCVEAVKPVKQEGSCREQTEAGVAMEKYSVSIKGSNKATPFCFGQAPPGILCPFLGTTIQKGCGETGAMCPKEGN